jgi:hypothetical protein
VHLSQHKPILGAHDSTVCRIERDRENVRERERETEFESYTFSMCSERGRPRGEIKGVCESTEERERERESVCVY